MVGTFQQQSRTRKLIYGGLIVVLFSATLVWKKAVVETQADALSLREQNLGEVGWGVAGREAEQRGAPAKSPLVLPHP